MILRCPDCLGKYNGMPGKDHTHTVTPHYTDTAQAGRDAAARGISRDDRFILCGRCYGVGAITCETCAGNGHVEVLESGIIRPYRKDQPVQVLIPKEVGRG